MKSCMWSPTGRLPAMKNSSNKRQRRKRHHNSKMDHKRPSAYAKSLMLTPTLSSLFFSSRPLVPCSSNSGDTFSSKQPSSLLLCFFVAAKLEQCGHATLMTKKKERNLSFSFGYNKWRTQNLTLNSVSFLHQLNISEEGEKKITSHGANTAFFAGYYERHKHFV